MKIINWNIYIKNKKIHKAIAFLRRQNADIVCLQEFPVEHLPLLERLGMHIATCAEIHIHQEIDRPVTRVYSVILSRFPIVNSSTIPHKKRYVPPDGKRDKYAYFQADTLYVDLDTHRGNFRVFNIHFKCFAGPNHRLSQFSEVVKYFSSDRHNIICGDFNSFAKPWINLLLWKWFSFKIQDIPVNEAKRLAKLFATHNLQNPLERQVTFLKFPIQLDYILIPGYMEIVSSQAFSRLHGSDHFPLFLEIKTPQSLPYPAPLVPRTKVAKTI